MQLVLDHIVPEPLKQNLQHSSSNIWKCKQLIENREKVFCRAASGKGKSTFIHILYGLRHDYEGSVQWSGKLVSTASQQQLSEWRSKELSIVFQDLRLFSSLTVQENLALKHSLGSDVPLQQIQEWLEVLGIASKWQQKAETLSYGERQRVAIIRSLIQPFTTLLLDEPFSHLDDANAQKAISLISMRLQQLKAGLILVDLEDNDWFEYDRKLLL